MLDSLLSRNLSALEVRFFVMTNPWDILQEVFELYFDLSAFLSGKRCLLRVKANREFFYPLHINFQFRLIISAITCQRGKLSVSWLISQEFWTLSDISVHTPVITLGALLLREESTSLGRDSLLWRLLKFRPDFIDVTEDPRPDNCFSCECQSSHLLKIFLIFLIWLLVESTSCPF